MRFAVLPAEAFLLLAHTYQAKLLSLPNRARRTVVEKLPPH